MNNGLFQNVNIILPVLKPCCASTKEMHDCVKCDQYRSSSCQDFIIYEPRREKTGLRGFRPGPTQTGLYKLRKELEA